MAVAVALRIALPRCGPRARELSLNVFKEGEEPKTAMADEEYPEWLKKLAYPPLTLEELEKMDVWEMDDTQRKRYWKLFKKKKLRCGLPPPPSPSLFPLSLRLSPPLSLTHPHCLVPAHCRLKNELARVSSV